MIPRIVLLHRVAAVIGLSCLVSAFTGCRRPFGGEDRAQSLRETIEQAVAREVEALPASDEPPSSPSTTRPQSGVLDTLTDRREELERLGPIGHGSQPLMDLGLDLEGRDQQRVNLSLQDAIASAIRRNLGIAQSRLQPEIAAEDVLQAEAVFDWLLFANVDLTKQDQPQQVPVLNGIPLGTRFAASETYRFETGVRKRLTSGTDVFLSTDLTRFQNNAGGIAFTPDPAYVGAVRLGVNQSVLRGFGAEVNRATIYLAENEEERSREQLLVDTLQLAADTERAYWELVLAWRRLAVGEWLVDVGLEVRNVLEQRREFDTRLAQYADAVATVEQRQADVIRARRAVRGASDRLKAIINDPAMTVSSEAVLYPLDATIEAPVTFSLREAVMSALDNRPEVRQAALLIDDAAIRQRVADNDALPLLDLAAQVAYYGLDDDPADAYDEVNDADFIEYVLGLAFEHPLGNNAAEARQRQARLERSSAVLNYRRTVQDVVLDVKRALRDVLTNHELIAATRSFRVAQAENLRALLVEEETLAGLTPEFLNLKFQRQEGLANARLQEERALVDFDQALADLHRAMGIGLQVKNIDVQVAGEEEIDLVRPSRPPSNGRNEGSVD